MRNPRRVQPRETGGDPRRFPVEATLARFHSSDRGLVMRARVFASVVALLAAAPVGGVAHAAVGGGRPEDSCLEAHSLGFGAGSTRPDREALTQLDDAAAWVGNGPGRYAYLAVRDEPREPVARARVLAAAERLVDRGVDARAVRTTSFAVLEPTEKQALEEHAPMAVKTCLGPVPVDRDWTQPPGDQRPKRSPGGLVLFSLLVGWWVVGPDGANRF
jgi:hypothetical protein